MDIIVLDEKQYNQYGGKIKMKNTTLVIMAAGMGSRYGQGIKQLEKVGPNGEIIMDYSIYDAKKAGFNKVVFITRKDIEKQFREVVGNRIEKIIDTEYVFQELDNVPEWYKVPEGRKKPWGTGHAILACKGTVKDPFIVINADDYYGREGFQLVHDYLVAQPDDAKRNYCMAGFILGNTLSDNGTVTRGVCSVDADSNLTSVEETFDILKKGDIAVGKDGNDKEVSLKLDDVVSMNMWGLTPDFLDVLDEGFSKFLKDGGDNNLKGEYLLPQVIGEMLKNKECSVKVLTSHDRWFGVTYHEDKETVVESLKKLTEQGVYPASIN
jgi:dTDP-glucose pyrophosphorylase